MFVILSTHSIIANCITCNLEFSVIIQEFNRLLSIIWFLQLSVTYYVKMYLVCLYKFSCSIQVWLWQIVSLADENDSSDHITETASVLSQYMNDQI